jgi:hypothetical protein
MGHGLTIVALYCGCIALTKTAIVVDRVFAGRAVELEVPL